MPPVKILTDQNELVPTKKVPKYLARFPFKEFNPVQSRVFEVYEEDANNIIAAATSSGKTVCAELYMAHEVRKRGGKAMYLVPLKALAKEKIDDWTSDEHHFSDLTLAICTGDYHLTPQRKKELEAADIIIMTSEMLNSRVRNYKAEQNEWLKDVGTLVVDESHLLTVQNRGDKLEVGLMKFTQVAPQARMVFLSATMPNVKEIAEWVSYQLTGKDTYLLQSDFRPCPLAVHYETHWTGRTYDDTEVEKCNAAIRIINDYPEDKFLVFVHTKRTGALMKAALSREGIEGEFHNADLEKASREALEYRFRNDKDFRVIIATSTLAWGMNLPARRVIVTGVHRGISPVDTYDIWQMVGRAGRVGLDPRGDAYILLPEPQAEKWERILSKPQDIMSRLLDHVGNDDNPHYKTLAFHLVSEIHHGIIKNSDDIHNWFARSLAAFQSRELGNIVDKTVELLLKCGSITEEKGTYKATPVGIVASMFYFSPFDVADLRKNFKVIFEYGRENSDFDVSLALGSIDTIKMGIVSKADRQQMSAYATAVSERYNVSDKALKGGYAYWCLMNGQSSGSMTGFSRNLQFDFPRVVSVLNALDTMVAKWDRSEWFHKLRMRVAYGVNEHLLDLCDIPKIGKVRADKLFKAGIKNADDFIKKREKARHVTGLKKDTIDEIVSNIKGRQLLN